MRTWLRLAVLGAVSACVFLVSFVWLKRLLLGASLVKGEEEEEEEEEEKQEGRRRGTGSMWGGGSRGRRRRKTVAFFHPYASAGGGGERVLWEAVAALRTSRSAEAIDAIVIYMGGKGPPAGDGDAARGEVVREAEERFGVALLGREQDDGGAGQWRPRIEVVRICSRALLEAQYYPVFTMLLQSLGSMVVALECVLRRPPDVFVDTMGCAFTFPVVRILCPWAAVATYVHYPTISSDMLSLVRERRPTYNNTERISGSASVSQIKLLYYQLFAWLYGVMGDMARVVMVNSTWTRAHIAHIWKCRPTPIIAFPPCDTRALQQLPFHTAERERTILSVGQFRPEKDHALQLLAFRELLHRIRTDSDPGEDTKDKSNGSDNGSDNEDDSSNLPRLVLLGSVRNNQDEELVNRLRAQAKELGITAHVDFAINVSHEELIEWLQRAMMGIHTMWNEHFGIGVVEMMAAGVIVTAHDSGGPKTDIVVPHDGERTGFLASTPKEYAAAMHKVLCMGESERRELQTAARASTGRFSSETFRATFVGALRPLLS